MQTTLILNRSNLREGFKEVPLEQVGDHLSIGISNMFQANIILFVDGDKVRVLKNRHGEMGITIPTDAAFKLLQPGLMFNWGHIQPSQKASLIPGSISQYFRKMEHFLNSVVSA